MEFQSHVYDIEVKETFNSLRSKYTNESPVKISHEMSNSEFIELQHSQVLKTLANEGNDKEMLKEKEKFVIPSISAAFLPLFGWRILTIDPLMIEGLLDYQCAIYSGNYLDKENKFVGFLEFIVYPFVKSNNYFGEDIRLEKLMNWLGHHRIFIRISDHIGLKSKLENTKLEFLHQQLLETFIGKETQRDNFLSAFEENPLPYNFVPIRWLVSKHTLSELLERTTDYKNRNGHQYLPDKIRVKIVPELFTDEHNHKITLNKKPGSPSKYIHDIEAIVRSIQ